MNYDIENKIIKNIFTQDQIDRVYSAVNSCPENKIYAPNDQGQLAFFIDMFDSRYGGSEDMYLVIENMISKEYGKDLKVAAIQFVRYTTKSGFKPELVPHFDRVFEKPMITVDVQMDSNIIWPVCVSGVPYTINNNEALIFSGTHQVHWRTKMKLEDDQYVDMIFCHLEDSQAEKISDEHRVEMIKKIKHYLNEYA
jgi:hypothetical protein